MQIEFKKLAGAKGVPWSSQRYALVSEGRGIPFTPTEYRLIYPLRNGTPVTYDDLARIVYNRDADRNARVMMEKHINRIRRKIIWTGFYVYCVQDYGYVLLPSRERYNA
ncbi:MAG TPA: hypothetical protein VHV10_02915 [Ktedonobacteraceae bacterium]|jgi:DNA-binding response OmpR family regulator|nr:hypothetical protein [Ktedonobacteraceae bacterium]